MMRNNRRTRLVIVNTARFALCMSILALVMFGSGFLLSKYISVSMAKPASTAFQQEQPSSALNK